MTAEKLVKEWFSKWLEGDYQNLPVTDDFEHVSPYGTISGKDVYTTLVGDNLDKFLGHEFVIHDLISEDNHACVRYTAKKGDFELDVSEWHYTEGDKIRRIVAYYNIPGEIHDSRKLKDDQNIL